jgi:coenzyme F420-0:L-glutamate ligase/coenzyme F420-1:gamma-L-glutamate ligase
MILFNIEYIGFQSKIIQPNGSVIKTFIDQIKNDEHQLEIKSGDIVAISSKVISMEQNKIVDLSEIVPTEKAKILAKKSNLTPNFVQLVLNETEEVIGVVNGALLTLHNGLVQANGGIDKSNAGINKAILLPENLEAVARHYKELIEEEFFITNIGILIIDSTTRPLRLGTVGLALASEGFPAVVDDRGLEDIFGYKMKITYRNIADNLASGANLIMGESCERIPFVVIRGLDRIAKHFKWKQNNEIGLKIDKNDCLYFSNLKYRLV